MEEFRESYVRQVGQQLEELPKQQKQTMLDGLRQELEEACIGLPVRLLPNQLPEEIAQELIDAVDPAVRRQQRTAKKRRLRCAFVTMVILLAMAVCCICYMYYVIQNIAGNYAVIMIEEDLNTNYSKIFKNDRH